LPLAYSASFSISARESARSAPSRASKAGQYLPDDHLQIPRFVGEAGDGGGRAGFLEERAQGLVGPQIAGLDDQIAFERTAFEQRLQGSGREASARARAHDLARGKHGHGLELDVEPVGIFLQARIVDAEDLAGRVVLGSEALGKLRGALQHQARVGAVEEDGLGQALERPQKGLGLMRLDGNHGLASRMGAEFAARAQDFGCRWRAAGRQAAPER
jgi:hypothetical protein